MLSTVYIVCFGAGFLFAIISFIFGEIFHAFHIDGDGPGAFSGSVLATFLAAFGFGGYATLHIFHLSPIASIVGGAITGLIGGACAYKILKFFYVSGEGSSDFSLADAIGTEGHTTVAIPAGGKGEVAFTAKEARQTSAAVSADGKEIARNRTVKIVRTSGDVLVVEEAQ